MQIQHTTVVDSRSVAVAKKENPDTIFVNWTGDVRNYVPQTYSRMASVCDYNLISSTGQIDLFEKVTKKKIGYWQIGYNPSLYHPSTHTPQTFQYDISFIGNCSPREKYPGAPTRIDACKLLKGAFGARFGLFGGGWPRDCHSSHSVDQRKVMDIYHNSLCCLSISHYNNLKHYFSDRLLMCLASGRPTISLKFPGWESYFTDMCDLIMVDSIKQIPDKVKMLKKDPDLANYIGASGAAKVAAEHTYLSRVRELLHMVGL
jgi:spore maturation protein CgeB